MVPLRKKHAVYEGLSSFIRVLGYIISSCFATGAQSRVNTEGRDARIWLVPKPSYTMSPKT